MGLRIRIGVSNNYPEEVYNNILLPSYQHFNITGLIHYTNMVSFEIKP